MWREGHVCLYITEVHDKSCEKKMLPCPNVGCKKYIQRHNISRRVSKCPHTLIPCKYQGNECDAELKRSQDLAAHEQDDKIHLHMALETVNSLHQTAKSQQAAIDSLQFVSCMGEVEGICAIRIPEEKGS